MPKQSSGGLARTERLRAFVAIELPEEIRAYLSNLEDRLKSGKPSFVRWVDPEGIHLTLKFLGNVASERLPQITGALGEAVQGFPPFRLRVSGLGLFPGKERPRVVWVGLEGDVEKLTTLQRRIEHTFLPLGFPKEDRDFTPHLTLARLREGAPIGEARRFGGEVMEARFEASPYFAVDSISLMRSTLTPSGAIYSRIASYPLPTPSA